jgi:hypothetical protein
MRASNLQHSTDWDTAYKGSKIGLTLVSKPARRHRISSKKDFSASAYFAFYAAVSIGIISYLYYLNQETIVEMLFGKNPTVSEQNEYSE